MLTIELFIHDDPTLWKRRPPNGAPIPLLTGKYTESSSILHCRSRQDLISDNSRWLKPPDFCSLKLDSDEDKLRRALTKLTLETNKITGTSPPLFSAKSKRENMHYRSLQLTLLLNTQCHVSDNSIAPRSTTRRDEQQHITNQEQHEHSLEHQQQRQQIGHLLQNTALTAHYTRFSLSVVYLSSVYLILLLAYMQSIYITYMYLLQHLYRKVYYMLYHTESMDKYKSTQRCVPLPESNCKQCTQECAIFSYVMTLYVPKFTNHFDKTVSLSHFLLTPSSKTIEAVGGRKKWRSEPSEAAVPPPTCPAHITELSRWVSDRKSKSLYQRDFSCSSLYSSPGSSLQREQTAAELSCSSTNTSTQYLYTLDDSRRGKHSANPTCPNKLGGKPCGTSLRIERINMRLKLAIHRLLRYQSACGSQNYQYARAHFISLAIVLVPFSFALNLFYSLVQDRVVENEDDEKQNSEAKQSSNTSTVGRNSSVSGRRSIRPISQKSVNSSSNGDDGGDEDENPNLRRQKARCEIDETILFNIPENDDDDGNLTSVTEPPTKNPQSNSTHIYPGQSYMNIREMSFMKGISKVWDLAKNVSGYNSTQSNAPADLNVSVASLVGDIPDLPDITLTFSPKSVVPRIASRPSSPIFLTPPSNIPVSRLKTVEFDNQITLDEISPIRSKPRNRVRSKSESSYRQDPYYIPTPSALLKRRLKDRVSLERTGIFDETPCNRRRHNSEPVASLSPSSDPQKLNLSFSQGQVGCSRIRETGLFNCEPKENGFIHLQNDFLESSKPFRLNKKSITIAIERALASDLADTEDSNVRVTLNFCSEEVDRFTRLSITDQHPQKHTEEKALLYLLGHMNRHMSKVTSCEQSFNGLKITGMANRSQRLQLDDDDCYPLGLLHIGKNRGLNLTQKAGHQGPISLIDVDMRPLSFLTISARTRSCMSPYFAPESKLESHAPDYHVIIEPCNSEGPCNFPPLFCHSCTNTEHEPEESASEGRQPVDAPYDVGGETPVSEKDTVNHDPIEEEIQDQASGGKTALKTDYVNTTPTLLKGNQEAVNKLDSSDDTNTSNTTVASEEHAVVEPVTPETSKTASCSNQEPVAASNGDKPEPGYDYHAKPSDASKTPENPSESEEIEGHRQESEDSQTDTNSEAANIVNYHNDNATSVPIDVNLESASTHHPTASEDHEDPAVEPAASDLKSETADDKDLANNTDGTIKHHKMSPNPGDQAKDLQLVPKSPNKKASLSEDDGETTHHPKEISCLSFLTPLEETGSGVFYSEAVCVNIVNVSASQTNLTNWLRQCGIKAHPKNSYINRAKVLAFIDAILDRKASPTEAFVTSFTTKLLAESLDNELKRFEIVTKSKTSAIIKKKLLMDFILKSHKTGGGEKSQRALGRTSNPLTVNSRDKQVPPQLLSDSSPSSSDEESNTEKESQGSDLDYDPSTSNSQKRSKRSNKRETVPKRSHTKAISPKHDLNKGRSLPKASVRPAIDKKAEKNNPSNPKNNTATEHEKDNEEASLKSVSIKKEPGQKEADLEGPIKNLENSLLILEKRITDQELIIENLTRKSSSDHTLSDGTQPHSKALKSLEARTKILSDTLNIQQNSMDNLVDRLAICDKERKRNKEQITQVNSVLCQHRKESKENITKISFDADNCEQKLAALRDDTLPSINSRIEQIAQENYKHDQMFSSMKEELTKIHQLMINLDQEISSLKENFNSCMEGRSVQLKSNSNRCQDQMTLARMIQEMRTENREFFESIIPLMKCTNKTETQEGKPSEGLSDINNSGSKRSRQSQTDVELLQTAEKASQKSAANEQKSQAKAQSNAKIDKHKHDKTLTTKITLSKLRRPARRRGSRTHL